MLHIGLDIITPLSVVCVDINCPRLTNMLARTCCVPRIKGWNSVRLQYKFCGRMHLSFSKVFITPHPLYRCYSQANHRAGRWCCCCCCRCSRGRCSRAVHLTASKDRRDGREDAGPAGRVKGTQR